METKRDLSDVNGCATIPISSPSFHTPIRANFIEHRVSKMDTLAGVAIKYGVEVADIRRMNGLVTDLQMFARKSLQIPLPGRHPPSPGVSNGSTQSREKTRRNQSHNIVDSLQSLKPKPPPRRLSPAMCSLQGYYGLTQSNNSRSNSRSPEGTEMSVFKVGKTLVFEEDDTNFLDSPTSVPVLDGQSSNGRENGDLSENISELDGSIRRRPKSDADPYLHTPEILLKEEGGAGLFSGRTGKGLALRPKLGSRTDLDEGRQNSSSGGDPLAGDVPLSVRKSSSASSLTESENISSSIWPTSKWSLKPDVIARPIFDGFQNPLAAWRNKAALD